MIHEVSHFYVGKLLIQRKQYIVVLTMQLYGLLSDSTDLFIKKPQRIENIHANIKFLKWNQILGGDTNALHLGSGWEGGRLKSLADLLKKT